MTISTLAEARAEISAIQKEIGKVIVGMDEVVESALICLLCGGHLLLEGAPGLGKTLLLKTLARATSLDCKRISFASDILPGDIVGIEVFDEKNKHTTLVEPGPIFTNLFLCDELNRAGPKSKSRILEPMQELQVTIGGVAHHLPKPFMVMATQNPLEAEGTYLLGRAELDRFLMKVMIGYPSHKDEIEIVRRYTNQQQDEIDISSVMDSDDIMAIRQIVRRAVNVQDRIYEIAVRIARATRPEEKSNQKAGELIAPSGGASPRVPIALVEAARVCAILRGREYVNPADLRVVALRILRHRLVFNIGVEFNDDIVGEFVENICNDAIGGER